MNNRPQTTAMTAGARVSALVIGGLTILVVGGFALSARPGGHARVQGRPAFSARRAQAAIAQWYAQGTATALAAPVAPATPPTVSPAEPSAAVAAIDSGVHICAVAASAGKCMGDDKTIRDLTGGQVDVYASDAIFGGEVIVGLGELDSNGDVVRNADGSGLVLGSSPDDDNADSSRVSYGLADVFDSAGVAPEGGTTYRLAVIVDRNDGSDPTTVGTADFTYQG